MDNKSSFNIFHIQNGFIENLWPNLLVLSDVNDFIDSLFSFLTGKIKNPIIKPGLFELTELFLNPQISFFISTVFIEFRFMEREEEMIVLRVEAWSFETNNEFFSVFRVLN